MRYPRFSISLQWLAVGLPIISTLVLAGWLTTAQIQQRDAYLHRQQEATLLLQLDSVSAHLLKEQEVAWNPDTVPLPALREQTRRAWQLALSMVPPEAHARLATLKTAIVASTDTPDYTGLQAQLSRLTRQLATQPDSRYLAQLRELRQGIADIRRGLQNLVMQDAASRETTMEALQHALWLSSYIGPDLTDRQQRLFNELFDSPWQSLAPRLQGWLDMAADDAQRPRLLSPDPSLSSLANALDNLIEDARAQVSTRLKADDPTPWANGLLAITFLPSLLALVVTQWLHQRQSARLRYLQSWVQALTCGDLTVKPHASCLGGDMLGQMAQSVDELRHHWRRSLSQIQAQAEVLGHWAIPPEANEPGLLPENPLPLSEDDATPYVASQTTNALGAWIESVNQYARLSQQLIERARTQAAQWADSTDSPPEALLQLQADIATAQQDMATLRAQLEQAPAVVTMEMASRTVNPSGGEKRPSGKNITAWAQLLSEFHY